MARAATNTCYRAPTPQHGGFATGWSPVYWGSIDDLFVNLTMPLRLLVGEYVDHYHRERNHQGLDNQLRQRPPPPVSLAADVQRRERLGGLLNFYHREAA